MKRTEILYRLRPSRRSLFVSAAVVVACAVGSAASQLPPNPYSSTGTPAEEGFPHFKEVAAEAGVEFVLDAGSPLRWYIVESNSAGVVVIDYDRDGWQDLYFVNGSTSERYLRKEPSRGNRLYRNTRDGRFIDVTQRAGVRGNGSWGMGGCVADVDNNGYDDIFVTNYGPNVLYLNNGDGTFRDATKLSGTDGGKRWHSGCGFGDYDADGDVDLYVSTYAEFTLEEISQKPPYTTARPDLPMAMEGPLSYPTVPHVLFENVGKGRFQDVSQKAGVSAAVGGHGFAVVWGDYDNDGDQDIYVANDLTPNHLFLNTGKKTFVENARRAGAAFDANGRPQASMGADAADYDNDGDLDLVVTNYALDHPTLYENERGLFSDVSRRARLGTSGDMGWGTQFVDLNLDGLQDLITIHGHLDPVMDHSLGPPGARPLPNLRADKAGYRQWSNLRRNRGKVFDLIVPGQLGDLFREPRVGRGLAVADLNNDGQMDIIVTNQEDRPSVFVSGGIRANWAMFKLTGTTSNRSAIGARVTLKSGGLTQIREVKSGGSYLSQSDLRVHFGLGSAARIDEIQVRWPSGHIQTQRGLGVNRLHMITEDKSP